VKIAQILSHRGPFVATIKAGASVKHLVDELRHHNIGALIVTEDGRHIEGIVSERDVVRKLSDYAGDVTSLKVADIMTTEVLTCVAEDTVDELMHIMTEHHIRHVPVVEHDGSLFAVVSIGDLVKYRIDELADERAALINYITQ
jgi:CBS domain-containing protein